MKDTLNNTEVVQTVRYTRVWLYTAGLRTDSEGSREYNRRITNIHNNTGIVSLMSKILLVVYYVHVHAS